MRLDDDRLRFSPTDLANYSACAHRTLLDGLRAHGRASVPKFEDPLLALLQERGLQHEADYLAELEARGRSVVRFSALRPEEHDREGYRRRAAETRAAMERGVEVIHQGTFYDGRWLGLVDFLLKVERPSDLGDWSYEVLDAKLSREAKATAIVQCCVYSDLLAEVQGVYPERLHLRLGGPRPRVESFRTAHFGAWHRALKGRFDALLGDDSAALEGDIAVAPEPVDHCRVCDWRSRCAQERVEVDHLSLVAGILRQQRAALHDAGIHTLKALGELDPAVEVAGIPAVTLSALHRQARLQLEGRRGEPVYELLDPSSDEAGRPLGLAGLPEPSPHDWFFDLESASMAGAEGDGLEYLWGVTDADDAFDAEWAFDSDRERDALRRFLTRALAHVNAHPDAHIYHFGHKEPTTLKRLVGRYGVGTDELDILLQRGSLVDLHRVVKQGVVASVTSYSLKAMEEVVGFERDVPLVEANRRRAAVEAGLAMGSRTVLQAGEEWDAALETVRLYNRDDCISTRVLRDWLEERRAELEEAHGTLARPEPKTERELTEEQQAEADEVTRLMTALLEGVSEDRDDRDDDQQLRWLMAHLLEWHRREDKTMWWDYFRMMDMPPEELISDSKPLGGLEYEGVVGKVKQSVLYRFRYPEQEHRIKPGKRAEDPASAAEEKTRGWNVHAIDESTRTVDLSVATRTAGEEEVSRVRALVPFEYFGGAEQRARLRKSAALLEEAESALAAWSPASVALLRAAPPTFDASISLATLRAEHDTLSVAVQAALALDGSVLPLQGPPGTGKTYTGARMIRALIRAGKRVGVVANSHKVVTNLVSAVCKADESDAPTPFVALQRSDDPCTDPRVHKVASGQVATLLDDGITDDDGTVHPVSLVAGTAWLWCREEMEGAVDVLFIDEAGQFSLANALAVAPAARSLVLLGDPQQLPQPQKGTHPPGTEVSVLEQLADADGIVTPDRGLFLEQTWRMRPEITAYTSELFYEGRLTARDHLAAQRLSRSAGETLHGLYYRWVDHEGNSRESVEEAREVVAVYRTLLDGDSLVTLPNEESRPLALDDLIVVAPYNAHVDRIRAELADAGFPGARVGTVDKFQGQEAAVAIYAMASSSAEDAPRGLAFLYAGNRLNVATSRARCATVIVASSRILDGTVRTPAQIRLLNAFQRYAERARPLPFTSAVEASLPAPT
ncbi:TM0106 family RecB-like putative nuclease [Gemmatimonadota bacterium DH-20]|uniref:TM0106 family RecB-like putative nuclease n=1 Tax=Gaopeijia maritima TaxID=3119007 RepID=A0ABU9ED67_9BACT